MAHIRRKPKRKDGTPRWEARIPDPKRPNTTHKIERTFYTKREAENWIAEQRHAVNTGTYIDPRQASRPFAELVEAWKESWLNLSPTTARRYDSILDNYLLPTFGTTPIAQLTHERVQRFVNRLAATHTPGTTRNVYAVLRTACSKGVRLGMVKVNPCLGVDLPRPNRQEMLFLTAEEVRAVAEAIDPQYRTLVYTAAYTGLRAGELAGLQRRDIDLLHSRLHVRRALKDVNGRLELGQAKTHAQRTVSLPSFLKRMLTEHLQDPAPGGAGPEEPVFTMKKGQLLRHGTFCGRYFKRAVQGYTKRGEHYPGALPPHLHGLRFHDLRHTCAALSIAAGAHPKLISARLGHSSITVTLDRYGHLFPSVEEALADALDATFATDRATPAAKSLERVRQAAFGGR